MPETLQPTKQYLLDHDWEEEDRRLELLEKLQDPATRRRVEALGIGTGSRCLEVEAGRGSIARWLAERVGPSGRAPDSRGGTTRPRRFRRTPRVVDEPGFCEPGLAFVGARGRRPNG